MADLPFAAEAGGQAVRLAVRLSPRASRNSLEGIVAGADGRVAAAIRLNAPPVDGAANEALIRFVAEALAVPKSSVTIRSGHTSRQKLLVIAGSSETLLQRLAKWLNPAPSKD